VGRFVSGRRSNVGRQTTLFAIGQLSRSDRLKPIPQECR